MVKNLKNILFVILGIILLLTVITLLYAWLKFQTDPTISGNDFISYLKNVLVTMGNIFIFRFGSSTLYGGAGVAEILWKFVPHTLILVFCTIIITACLCLVYGFYHFYSDPKEKKIRNYIRILLSIFPGFVVAKIAYIAFSNEYTDSLFPKGNYWIGFDSLTGNVPGFGLILSYLIYLILPVVILVISDGNLYYFFSSIKNKIHQLKKEPFIEFKYLHGYDDLHIFFRHVVPHITLHLLHQLRYRFVYLISSAAVVEAVFHRDGIGFRLIEVAQYRIDDMNLLLSILYITGILVILSQQIIWLLENKFYSFVVTYHWMMRRIKSFYNVFYRIFKHINFSHTWRIKRIAWLFIVITGIIGSVVYIGSSNAGSDQRLIKDGEIVDQELQHLKNNLVDGWGALNTPALNRLAKFKYATYVNLMNFDLRVLLKAAFYSFLIPLTGMMMVGLLGIPAGILLGYARNRSWKEVISSAFISPFDIIPKFFLLAVILSLLRFSSIYQWDGLYLLIYIGVFALLHLPEFVKMISLYVEEVKLKNYYIIGEVMGIGFLRKIIVYIAKNIKYKIVVECIRIFISILFLEAALSYFGFGVPTKRSLYVLTLGQIINKYTVTLNFLSSDWSVNLVKLMPLFSAFLALAAILFIAQLLMQQLAGNVVVDERNADIG